MRQEIREVARSMAVARASSPVYLLREALAYGEDESRDIAVEVLQSVGESIADPRLAPASRLLLDLLRHDVTIVDV